MCTIGAYFLFYGFRSLLFQSVDISIPLMQLSYYTTTSVLVLAASCTELAAREESEENYSIALPAKAIEIVENYPSLISMTLILQNNTKIT